MMSVRKYYESLLRETLLKKGSPNGRPSPLSYGHLPTLWGVTLKLPS